MMVASTPDTVTPVVEQCEASGCPVVSTDCPWQTYMGQNTEYKWSYHSFFGAEDFFAINESCYSKIPSNKVDRRPVRQHRRRQLLRRERPEIHGGQRLHRSLSVQLPGRE